MLFAKMDESYLNTKSSSSFNSMKDLGVFLNKIVCVIWWLKFGDESSSPREDAWEKMA